MEQSNVNTPEELHLSQALGTIRVNVCIVMQGLESKNTQWPAGVEEFVRKLYKLGISVAIVGPKAIQKMGTKSHLKFFDRHDVVSLKKLQRAKQQPIELRILGRKLKAWTRLRCDICIVSGANGVWPAVFPGWTSQGVLTIDALLRWVTEFGTVPGRKFMFLGSSNRVLSWATTLLDRGAESCMVVESTEKLKAWRSHRDRFLSRGGRVFTNHQVLKVQEATAASSHVYLKNNDGTLVLDVDTIVLSSMNQESLNAPSQWDEGLIYVQRHYHPDDPVIDEGPYISRQDWAEVFWIVCRKLVLADKAEITGALDRTRDERKKLWFYRKNQMDLAYNGKNLERGSIEAFRKSGSVPLKFSDTKPLASLECLENVPCTSCVNSCPVNAIFKKDFIDLPQLNTDLCTGCGACVAACPSGAAVMVKDHSENHMAKYYLPDDTRELWKDGDMVHLQNRKGDTVASGKVIASTAYQNGAHRVIEIESPSYNLWDARTFKKQIKPGSIIEDEVQAADTKLVDLKKDWITLNGVKRLSSVDVPISVALWKMGYRRFEDAMFCPSGDCRLCVVKKNSRDVLACKEILSVGDNLEYTQTTYRGSHDCFCSQSSQEEVEKMKAEGVGESLACEISGFGLGTCKGRWCLNRDNCHSESVQKQRPKFPGFEKGIWREVHPFDIL